MIENISASPLYILLISIRGHDLELGRDADTGGQTKYVIELAKALAENTQLIRIEAGPEGYIRKEERWDHLDSFADNLLTWLHNQPHRPFIGAR